MFLLPSTGNRISNSLVFSKVIAIIIYKWLGEVRMGSDWEREKRERQVRASQPLVRLSIWQKSASEKSGVLVSRGESKSPPKSGQNVIDLGRTKRVESLFLNTRQQGYGIFVDWEPRKAHLHGDCGLINLSVQSAEPLIWSKCAAQTFPWWLSHGAPARSRIAGLLRDLQQVVYCRYVYCTKCSTNWLGSLGELHVVLQYKDAVSRQKSNFLNRLFPHM